MRGRINLAFGHADYDLLDMVRVGDRLVPRAIDVYFPSTDDLPQLHMRIEVRSGSPVCTRVEIAAKDNGREVRSVDLRAVRLEDWVEDIVAATAGEIADSDGKLVATFRTGNEDAHRAAVATIRAARRGSRRAVSDDLLRRVADTYREHVDDRPTEAVQRVYGVAYRTAARYVQLCRARGFLPETSPGKRRA